MPGIIQHADIINNIKGWAGAGSFMYRGNASSRSSRQRLQDGSSENVQCELAVTHGRANAVVAEQIVQIDPSDREAALVLFLAGKFPVCQPELFRTAYQTINVE
jgi:hypothetical protein